MPWAGQLGVSRLFSSCVVPKGLTAAQAQSIRTTVTLAAERTDHRERRLFAQQPAHRICLLKFLEDGLLLPFGHERGDFTIPNPTFFQTASWPMKDNADPVDGWSLPEILRTNSGAAKNDLYGKLFYHIRDLLISFHRRLALHGSEFYFFNINATELSNIKSLEGIKFARIEVANLSDGGYLGIAKTLAYMGPLLLSPSENPHATLITLFMNAVEEVVERFQDTRTMSLEVSRAAKFSRWTSRPRSQYDPQFLMNAASCCLVRDVDTYFARYMEDQKFKDIEENSWMIVDGGLVMKESHTIVEKWPMKLKLQFGQAGAQQEFDVLQSSGHSGSERYVEWKRKA